jgi:hypothetical protein
MAAAEGMVDDTAWGLCGLTSWLFFRERIPLEGLETEDWRNEGPAGDESLEERGDAYVDGDLEAVRECKLLAGPAEEGLERASTAARDVWGAAEAATSDLVDAGRTGGLEMDCSSSGGGAADRAA